jgi:predicted RNase H-like nuclease (RuvC/YqgF family)
MELSREASPVKIIYSFSRDGIREVASSKNIKGGDVVLLQSSKGGGSHTASLLIELGVKAVITTDKMSHQAKEAFEKNMIPLLEADKIDLKMADDFAVIMNKELNREIDKWTKNQEEKKKKEDRNKLLKIMDDYKAQRKRSSHNS